MKSAYTHSYVPSIHLCIWLVCGFGLSEAYRTSRGECPHCCRLIDGHDGWAGFAYGLIVGTPRFYNCDDTLRDDVFQEVFSK